MKVNSLASSNIQTVGAVVKRLRVAHLATHPIQYFVPLYRELASRPQIDLTVYYFSDFSLHGFTNIDFGEEIKWDVPLLDGYKHRFCPSAIGRGSEGLNRKLNWDVLAELSKQRYDAIWAMSYSSTNAVLARIAAGIQGIPILFRDDTNLLTPRPAWKRAVKQMTLRPLLHGAWGLFVGQENKRYWSHYGIPEKRLRFTPHCVDNSFFQNKARELSPNRGEIRRHFGIATDAPVILFCGKFIEKKQPLLLLSAYAKIRKCVPCWLLLAGDGPLRAAIEDQVRQHSIPGVLMPGFLNQGEMPLAYAASDLLALPSGDNETWGLVVNEAMNFGLPIVVSDRVGCAPDLVESGWNGFVFPFQDVDAFSEALGRLIEDELLRREFGLRSLERIAGYSVRSCADGIISALLAATHADISIGKAQIVGSPTSPGRL